MSSREERQGDSLDDAIGFFASRESVSRAENRLHLQHLTVISRHSQQRGLNPNDINDLMSVIHSSKFPIKVKKYLLHCLLPCDVIPYTSIMYALSAIGVHNTRQQLKVELVKWILIVWESIEPQGKENLCDIYDFIFGFISYEYLCPLICNLLCKITNPHIVTKFHVRELMRMESNLGPQPHIQSLLGAIQAYRPDLVTIKSGARIGFRAFHTRFANLYQAQQRNIRNLHSPLAGRPALHSGSGNVPGRTVIDKNNAIDFLKLSADCSVPTWDSLTSLLQSSVRPVLLSGFNDASLLTRLEFLVRIEGYDQLFCNTRLKNAQLMLENTLKLVKELQQGIHEIEKFMCECLNVWDGCEYKDVILGLISHWNLCPFEQLDASVLKPLQTLMKTSSTEFQCDVLMCLIQLLKNWVLFARDKYIETTAKPRDRRKPLEKQLFQSFPQADDDFDPNSSVRSLVTYIEKICIWLLVFNEGPASLVLDHIFRFYHLLLDTDFDLILSSPVPFHVFSRAILSYDPFILSEFCGLVLKYHKILRKGVQRNWLPVHHECIHRVNKYLNDFTLLFVKNQDLSLTFPLYQRNKFYKVSSLLRDHPVLFNMWMHPALFGITLRQRSESAIHRVPVQYFPLDIASIERKIQLFIESGLSGMAEFFSLLIQRKEKFLQ